MPAEIKTLQDVGPVIEQVSTEIAAVGDNIKQLSEDTEKALAEARSFAEEHVKSVDVVVDEKITKMMTEVTEKNAAVEEAIKRVQEIAEEAAVAVKRKSAKTHDDEARPDELCQKN